MEELYISKIKIENNLIQFSNIFPGPKIFIKSIYIATISLVVSLFACVCKVQFQSSQKKKKKEFTSELVWRNFAFNTLCTWRFIRSFTCIIYISYVTIKLVIWLKIHINSYLSYHEKIDKLYSILPSGVSLPSFDFHSSSRYEFEPSHTHTYIKLIRNFYLYLQRSGLKEKTWKKTLFKDKDNSK